MDKQTPKIFKVSGYLTNAETVKLCGAVLTACS